MTPKEYREMILKTYNPEMKDNVLYCMIGLAGEAGEICNMAQKRARGDDGDQRQKLIEEMGGVLYYLTALALHLDVTLEEVREINGKKLLSRLERGTIRGDGDDR